MDPRPYHFDYRRPRLNNPTFQSLRLYQSIYQLENGKKSNPEQTKHIGYGIPIDSQKQNHYRPQRRTPQSQPESIKRNQSSDIVPVSKITSDRRYENRMHRNDSERLNSSLSHYGSNLMNGSKLSGVVLDQNRIYEKQQKEFNIISYQPKGYTPRLRNFPKLTLEDQLIQRRSLQNAI